MAQPAAEKKRICLLILGPTGSGKSTFIAKAAGLPESDVGIGHGLDSCVLFLNGDRQYR